MQRHTKRSKTKVIIAFFMSALVVVMTVIQCYAITPPIATNTTAIYGGSSNLTQTDADAVVNYVRYLYELNYFQFGDFVLVGRRGSTTRMYVIQYGSYSESDDGTQTVITGTYPGIIVEYNFVSDGVSTYGYTVNGESYTFQNVNILLTVENGVITRNTSYTYGTSTSSAFQTTVAEWADYYDKVYNYDTKIGNATQTGFDMGIAQAQATLVPQARQEGYETGYDEGYVAGYDDAEADYADEYQNGFEAGKTEGVAQGYETGYDEGYETGYADAEEYFEPLLQTRYNEGYVQGYDKGYEDGSANGGPVTIVEELDIGSIISALPEGAKAIIDGALGFEIFGINVAGTLTSILVVAIVGFVVKWLLSLRS